jgi:hypothetical protein
MYKDSDYIHAVNKTYSKPFSKKQILPKYIFDKFDHMKERISVLDFGAGKDAYGTSMLREHGFDVTAYDIGKNSIEGTHDTFALSKKYEVIFASNVLNIQTSHDDIIYVLQEIKSCMQNKYLRYGHSHFYCNLPSGPRKCDIDNSKLYKLLIQSFGKFNVKLVSKNPSIYRCDKIL